MGSANLVCVLLSVSCCFHGAAYQELLLVRPGGDAEKTVAWPVEHTQLDFMRVIQESLAAMADTPRVQEDVQRSLKEKPEEPPIVRAGTSGDIVFSIINKDPGIGIFLNFPQPCQTRGTKTYCHIDFEEPIMGGKVNIVHNETLYANSTFRLHFEVDAKFVHPSSFHRCPVCGQPCQGTFLGRVWTVDLPACPIQAGTWSFSLPFLTKEESDALELIPSFSVKADVAVFKPRKKLALWEFEGTLTI